MKIIAFILSLYVFGLNLLACSDSNSSQIISDSQITANTLQNLEANHSHGMEADLCPPFCSCHCCHVHTVDFGTANFEPLITEIPSKAFVHFDSLGEEPILTFLDPPRV